MDEGPATEIRAGGLYSLSTVAGDLIFVAGMTPKVGDKLTRVGRFGAEVDAAAGAQLAGSAAERAVTVARAAAKQAGGVVTRIAQLTVFIAVADDFTALSEVADGASGALSTLGAPPARATVGVRTLPGGAPVEVRLVAVLER